MDSEGSIMVACAAMIILFVGEQLTLQSWLPVGLSSSYSSISVVTIPILRSLSHKHKPISTKIEDDAIDNVVAVFDLISPGDGSPDTDDNNDETESSSDSSSGAKKAASQQGTMAVKLGANGSTKMGNLEGDEVTLEVAREMLGMGDKCESTKCLTKMW